MILKAIIEFSIIINNNTNKPILTTEFNFLDESDITITFIDF
jgi:hypothetical protein